MPPGDTTHLERQPDRPTAGRFIGLSVVSLAALVGGTVAFVALLALVTAGSPLVAADRAVAGTLNDTVAGRPVLLSAMGLVTDLGGSPASWVVLTTLTAWLLVRRQHRLAVFVAVTGLGAWVLSVGVKELVGRLRPVVEIPVATAPGPSFPSGHALGSTVTYGVLLLVFLPVLPRRARVPTAVAAGLLVVAIGFTRLALGVHFLSDVLGGWLLGLGWLAVTTTAFRAWRRSVRLPDGGPGLSPEAAAALRPAPGSHGPVLPHPWQRAAELVIAWVLLLGVLLGAGWLVTQALAGSAVDRLNVAAVRWFVEHREPALRSFAAVASALGGTAVAVALALVAASLVLAATRRWRPVLFLAVAMVGEVTLFLATVSIVGRARPPVEHLGPGLPPTSSFPSGHVAAATTLFGGVAVLFLAWTRAWWRWLALAGAAVAVLLVAAARLYYGVHYPTDVLAGLVLGLAWLSVCAHVLRPGPGAARGSGSA
jgi:undecaprenyl-diphosphatase